MLKNSEQMAKLTLEPILFGATVCAPTPYQTVSSSALKDLDFSFFGGLGVGN
jgi:hypothetical protein